MVKIEAIIRPPKLIELKQVMVKLHVHGMTILEAGGFGRQIDDKEQFHANEYSVELVPKLMVVLITTEDMVEKITTAIRKVCYTGSVGDGKIFVYPVTNVIRIRTGEEGEAAL